MQEKVEVGVIEQNEQPVSQEKIPPSADSRVCAEEVVSKIEAQIKEEEALEAKDELGTITNSVGLGDEAKLIAEKLSVEPQLKSLNEETKTLQTETIQKINEVSGEGDAINQVEMRANSKENASQFLFSRISNPVIQSQIINLLKMKEKYLSEQEEEETVYDENGDFVFDENNKLKTRKIPSSYVPQTEEALRQELDFRANQVMNDTPIVYGTEMPTGSSSEGSREKISLGFELDPGIPMTVLQKSIIEAHEKGHVLRPYDGNFLRDYFSSGFDLSAVDYTKEDYEKGKIRSGETDISFEEARQEVLEYVFDAREIAERMSQLKNYFGIKGDEQFTKSQLEYAKEHYVEDTKMNNNMSQFFQAITKDKEDKFVELINNSGI